jgi:Overcoming lysogenization defect protein-like, TOPRIM domain
MANATISSVLLVEGPSDGAAVRVLAERLGRDLDAEGVSIVPMGGYGSLGRFLERYGPAGLDVRLAGLYDAPEERHFSRGLARAGFGSSLMRADLEELGFYACDANLEDELTRALGPAAMEELLEVQGELRAFRTYQKQPAHRHEPIEAQLSGFLWNRKLRYGALIVGALDLDRIPRPLTRVLAHALPEEASTGCRRSPSRRTAG